MTKNYDAHTNFEACTYNLEKIQETNSTVLQEINHWYRILNAIYLQHPLYFQKINQRGRAGISNPQG